MTASVGGAAQRLPAWIRTNLVGLLVTAIVSGVVGYVVNVWLMAVRYEGSVTPEGAPAMSKDNVIAGGIFWAMFPMVVCSAIGYRRAVGRERFWRDVRRLPITLVGLFRRDGSHGWVHLLWGAAIALAATMVVPPAVGAVLGVGLLVGVPSIVGSVLSTVFAQLWRLVGRVVAPTKDHRVAPVLKVAVGILGWAVALVIGFVLPGEWIRLVLALGCAAAAFLLGRRASAAATGVTAALVLVGVGVGAVLADVVTAAAALGDDGGFAECGSTLEGWIRRCSGAGEIRRRALLGAIVATQFGALGYIAGGLIGSAAADSLGPWWERLDGEELPRGPIDPSTGEALVVNDGRWPDVPLGHVYFEGAWAHPEAVGAVVPDESPFALDPRLAGLEDDDGVHPRLWVPPLVAAAVAGTVQGGRTGRRAEAREAAATVAEAEALRVELAAAATDEERARVLASFRAKAIALAADPAARQVLADGASDELRTAVRTELEQVDTEVLGVFVERVNDLGVARGGQPVDADDVAELRARAEPAPPQSLAPSNLGKLWKGYGAKRGKFAIDAATYLRFLEDRRDDAATSAEDRAVLARKIERLRAHVDEGVETVMVSEQIWNEVAQFAYALALREVTGPDSAESARRDEDGGHG